MKYWMIGLVWMKCVVYCNGQDDFIQGYPRLAYWEIGQSKEIVIILHGGPGIQHQYLRPEFDALSKTAKVIYYDQRGCGKSERFNSYIWQDHVADLKRLISSSANDQKVFLAGSSWGSMLAILYTYTHPEDIKGVILSGTLPWDGQEKLYERDSSIAKRPINVLKGL